jgi:hypothetical protein
LIKDLSDLLTQIISGGVLLLIAAAIGLWLKGGRESRKKREPIPKTRQQAFPAFQIGKKGHDIDIIGGELEGFDKVAEIGDESYKVRFKNVKARTKKKRFWFW